MAVKWDNTQGTLYFSCVKMTLCCLNIPQLIKSISYSQIFSETLSLTVVSNVMMSHFPFSIGRDEHNTGC